MTVQSSDMFEGNPENKCDLCGKAVRKWIENCPAGNLCINCAQNTMRVLFEDIIDYHNGKHVSLLGIMYHGRKDADMKRLAGNLQPNGKPVEGKSLFDF